MVELGEKLGRQISQNQKKYFEVAQSSNLDLTQVLSGGAPAQITESVPGSRS